MTTVPLRRIATVVNGGTPAADSLNWGGEVAWATPVDLGRHDGRTIGATERTLTDRGLETGSSMVPEGSIILSTRAPIGYVCVNRVAMAFNQGCRGVIPRTDVSTDYLRYALLHLRPRLQAAGTGSTFMELSTGSLASMPVPVVGDRGQQDAVVDFLDRETAKVDALIAKQEELGRAVREHLHGVQDGLVSLSEGGLRFKYLVDEVDCRAGAEWERLPLLSVSIHWGVRRRDEVTDDLPRAEDLSNYKVVESGDIVVNRMRAFQGALGRSPIDGIVSPDYLVLRAAANVRSDWLAAAMRTPEFISEMAARVRGIGSAELGTVRTPRINADELGEIRLDVPTPPEQEARYVTRRRSESQAAVLLERIDSLTDALKERRAALITAAVTGRLDVTTYGKAG